MKNLYPRRETKHLELKETLASNLQIVKTCVAFANNGGGEIIFGVEDKSLEIKGVSDSVRDAIFESLSNAIYDSISPMIMPEIYQQAIDSRTIVVVKIYPGPKPPYFVKSEGIKNGVYLRVGTNTRRASEEYIQELFRMQKHLQFDEEASSLTYLELNPQLIQEAYGKPVREHQLIGDKVLVRDDRSPSKLLATHAGVLFFANKPEVCLPESIVICTEFKGVKGRDILRTVELDGPIPSIIENTLKTVASWLEKIFKIKKNGRLVGSIPVPIEALREAVINALIHRKYFIPGAVKVAIYEDRIEIFSPGAFPGLITPSNIGDGTTFLRNPHLAKMARKVGLVEKMGSGARLIFESCEKAKLKRPVYSEEGDFVKLTFYFEKNIDSALSTETKILTLLREHDEIRISNIVSKIGISRNSATRHLNRLIDQKKVIRSGKGPATIFRMT